MKKTWLLLAIAVFVCGGTAVAQQNAGIALIDSPVKTQAPVDAGPTVVRSVAFAGSSGFGVCEDRDADTIWFGALFTGGCYEYDKALNLIGTMFTAVGTSVGMAWDYTNDTMWIGNPATLTFDNYDQTGVFLGSVSYAATGGGIGGPITIDPDDTGFSFWQEDIALDACFQLDIAGALLNSHPNPEGSGVFGNGLSYNYFDLTFDPGDLHITSGTGGEGQVSRIWNGQPSSGFPRPYVELFNIAFLGTFVNGIQNSEDLTADPSEVWYILENASNVLYEINNVPISPLSLCAPGATNLGVSGLPPAVYEDDMESGEGAEWAHGAVIGTDDWAIGTTPYAQSPVNAWKCIDDQTYTDKYLDVTVDLTATDNEFRFYHTFYFESGRYDGGILEISTDGGATYNYLLSEIVQGGYTGIINANFGNPLGAVDAWVEGGSFGAMEEVVVDLSGYAPATGAIVRWRFGADSCCGPGSLGGWQIDDVRLGPAFSDPCDQVLADTVFVNKADATVAFSDDLESGEQAWWAHGAAIGTDDWAIGSTPYAQSPVNAWQCIDDQTYTDKYLDLTVDVTAPDTELRFWHTYYFESFFYDGGILEVSTDSGATFTQLDAEIVQGGYTGVINANFGNPLGAVPAWVEGTAFGPMEEVKVDLSGYTGTGIVVRWRFGADSCCGPGSLGGWKIDDVSLGGAGYAGTGGADYVVDEFGQSDPLFFTAEEAPGAVGDAATSAIAVYAWEGEPGETDVVTLPDNLGDMCFGYPAVATVQPRRIFTTLGNEALYGGHASPQVPPTIPDGGSVQWSRRPNGTGKTVTATVQGLIEDPCSLSELGISVTNGWVLVIP